jgi:hypothetical protein
MTDMKLTICVALSLVLTGCTSMNIFKDSPSVSDKSIPDDEPDVALSKRAPDENLSAAPSKGTLNASQIRKALSGKSWKWNGAKTNGVTLFADDGSSLIEFEGLGTTTGKWEARDGELCESVAPAPFLPKGQDLLCRPMSGSGSKYKVGPATFTLA